MLKYHNYMIRMMYVTGHATAAAEVPRGHHHSEDREGADGGEPAQ